MNKNYKLGDVAKGKHYGMVAQSKGSILWWVLDGGELKTHVSNGRDFHCQIVKNASIHRIFRGRFFKGTLTILPPSAFCSSEIGNNWVNIPEHVLIPLLRKFKPKIVMVEMGDSNGMRILNVTESI